MAPNFHYDWDALANDTTLTGCRNGIGATCQTAIWMAPPLSGDFINGIDPKRTWPPARVTSADEAKSERRD